MQPQRQGLGNRYFSWLWGKWGRAGGKKAKKKVLMNGLLQQATGARSHCKPSKEQWVMKSQNCPRWGSRESRGFILRLPSLISLLWEWVAMGQTWCYLYCLLSQQNPTIPWSIGPILQIRNLRCRKIKLAGLDSESSLISSTLWCNVLKATAHLFSNTADTPCGLTEPERCLHVFSLSPCKEKVIERAAHIVLIFLHP